MKKRKIDYDVINELDKLNAAIELFEKLDEGEQPASEKGWITADELEIVLGL